MQIETGRLLPQDGILDLAPRGRAEILVRSGGSLHLSKRACPHQGLPLAGARLERGSLVCRWHGCRFRLGADRAPSPRRLLSTLLEEIDGSAFLPD